MDYRRKIKCDRIHPICSNCTRSKATCAYDAAAVLATIAESKRRETSAESETHIEEDEPAADPETQIEEDEATAESETHLEQDALAAEGSADAPQGPERPPVPPDLGAKLDKLLNLLDDVQRTRTSTVGGPSTISRPISPRNIGRETFGPSETSSSAQDRSRARRTAADDDNPAMAQPPSPPDPTDDIALGHLSLHEDSGQSRYIGNTHWAYIASEIAELNQLLREGPYAYSNFSSRRSSQPPIPRRSTVGDSAATINSLLQVGGLIFGNPNQLLISPPQSPFGGVFPGTSEHPSRFEDINNRLFNGLPTKRQCHLLYRCYITGAHVLIPLGHPQTMLQWYEGFWQWYETRHMTSEPYGRYPFIPLLYAILYGGALSCSIRVLSAEFPHVTRLELTNALHEKVIDSLNLMSFLRAPNLPGLIAFMIVQTMCVKEEEPLLASLSFALILRIAETMGLHREPSKFGIEPREAEVRRRVWWQILFFGKAIHKVGRLQPTN